MSMKYIILYTVPDPDFETTTKGQIFDTIEDARRNAEYLSEGEGATPVEIYSAELVEITKVT